MFVAADIDRGFLTIIAAHTTLTMCFVTVVVAGRGSRASTAAWEEAAMDLGLPAGADLPDRDAALDRAPRVAAGFLLGLLALARRSGDRELHHRSGRHHPADADLFRGAAGA